MDYAMNTTVGFQIKSEQSSLGGMTLKMTLKNLEVLKEC